MKSVESMSSQSFGWALPFATKTKTLRPLSGALFRNCRASSSACHKRSSLPLALHNASPWHAAVLSLSLSDEEPFQTCGWILVATIQALRPTDHAIKRVTLFCDFESRKKAPNFPITTCHSVAPYSCCFRSRGTAPCQGCHILGNVGFCAILFTRSFDICL